MDKNNCVPILNDFFQIPKRPKAKQSKEVREENEDKEEEEIEGDPELNWTTDPYFDDEEEMRSEVTAKKDEIFERPSTRSRVKAGSSKEADSGKKRVRDEIVREKPHKKGRFSNELFF